jgi:phosphatidylinositol glycan class B
LILAVTAWNSEGWLQPDEHARVIEPASMLAYGYAALPWEISGQPPIVSWFLGFLMAPVLMVTKWLQFSSLNEAATIRFVSGVVASTRFLALTGILRRLGFSEIRQRVYLAFMALAVFGPVFLVRSSQENFACTALVWATWMGLRLTQDGHSRGKAFLFGVFLALTAACRPQVGIAAAGLGLFVVSRLGVRIIPGAAAGMVAGLLPIALIDTVMTGTPFGPAIHYLAYALSDEGGGKQWGVQPWWYYIPEFFESWYPPLGPILLIFIVAGAWRHQAILWTLLPFTIAHVILGHKETRYFSPMIPFLQLSMFAGFEIYEKKWVWLAALARRKNLVSRVFIFTAAVTLGAGLLPLNSSPWMYHMIGQLARTSALKEFTYIGNSMTGVSKFYSKMESPPPYEHVTWNNFVAGQEVGPGWLAFYALDPEDFERVEQLCGTEGLQGYPRWMIHLIESAPRSPARRKINPIVHCPSRIRWDGYGSVAPRQGVSL